MKISHQTNQILNQDERELLQSVSKKSLGEMDESQIHDLHGRLREVYEKNLKSIQEHTHSLQEGGLFADGIEIPSRAKRKVDLFRHAMSYVAQVSGKSNLFIPEKANSMTSDRRNRPSRSQARPTDSFERLHPGSSAVH
jgi:hypothetical protein